MKRWRRGWMVAVAIGIVASLNLTALPAGATDPVGTLTTILELDANGSNQSLTLTLIPGEQRQLNFTIHEDDEPVSTAIFSDADLVFFNASGAKLTSLTLTAGDTPASGTWYCTTAAATITSRTTQAVIILTTSTIRLVNGPITISSKQLVRVQ